MTSWAIRSPRWNRTGLLASVFSRVTLISPRYPASTVPGAFTSVTPCLAARPERGCTNAAYPSGRAIAIPVRTRARSPGPSSMSSAVVRSAPASPEWAYDGSGTSGSRRLISTSGWECGNGELPTAGTHGEDSATSGHCRILRAAGSRISPSQLGHRPGDHGDDRHGNHGSGDAGQHAADRERQDHRQRVQPDHPPDDLRLQQVPFQLILDDQHAEQDYRGDPALGGQRDQDGQGPGHQ